MPNYRRLWIPGCQYFVTMVTYGRQRLFVHEAVVGLWREALSQSCRENGFVVHAAVVLHDHIHMIIILSPGRNDVGRGIGRAKALFTRCYTKRYTPAMCSKSESRYRHREEYIWQRRFYDHLIRDQRDYRLHMDYIHYNPVKHGYVKTPGEWKWSSFRLFCRKGLYREDWRMPADDDLSQITEMANRLE